MVIGFRESGFILKLKKNFDSQLPATPCYLDVRKQMVEIAKREGVSLAEVQRAAFSLFLSTFSSNYSNDDTESSKGVPPDLHLP